jgi:hypothetical protein
MVSFRCYDPSSDRRGGIHGWYARLLPEIRAEFDAALETLQYVASLSGRPDVEAMRGACAGLTEVKIDVQLEDEEVHIRLLGVHGPGRREFTILGAMQKQSDADYGRACRSALRRKQRVERDGRRALPCQFP